MKISSRSILAITLFASACTTTRQTSKGGAVNQNYVEQNLLNDSVLQNAQAGVAIYDPSENKYLYSYKADQYFTPASNMKLFSCYAAMKYLGDSITGINYFENDSAIFLYPTGDPTLLHPDYQNQPVIRFLQQSKKNIYINPPKWNTTAWGEGWSWDDYADDYMVERSSLPVYGNVVQWVQENNDTTGSSNPDFVPSPSIYSNPEVNWKVRFTSDTSRRFRVGRDLNTNTFFITQGLERKASQYVPFVTNGLQSALELLPDTIGKDIAETPAAIRRKLERSGALQLLAMRSVYSQPLDSMLKPMMHRSDNFFAEQCLQMVSYDMFREFNEKKVIDSLLKKDLKDLPQSPAWADGSGLSRMNLFSPQDFVTLLHKMEKEFGLPRMKNILATGGTGTLKNYYRSDSNYIFAKTGTLRGVVALSGYLITEKGRTLIFSVLVNNHNGSSTAIRRKVEAFLNEIRRRN